MLNKISDHSVTDKNSNAPVGSGPQLRAIEALAPSIAASSSSTRILFVEDDKVYFGLLKRIIETVEDAAFDIFWAQNMQGALEILKNQTVDIILLDLMLPDSCGLATFQCIHENAVGTPVIVLSAVSDEKQAMEAVYLGAQDFLIKGQVGVQSLIRCIRYTLARLQVTEYQQRLQAIADFTAALAHDLRGPIIGADRVLNGLLSRPDNKMPAEDVAMLKILQNNNNFLRNKVDELLAIYRLESEADKYNFAPISLDAVIRTCIRTISSHSGEIDRKIICQIDKKIKVKGNKQALTQLFTNLLENSIKFSEANSAIEVIAERAGRFIKLIVKDYGAGIAPEDVQSLFKKFWRGGNHSFVPGTGLGLYLCEKIVRAHGGAISCESKLGEGSTFVVTLPESELE